MSAQITINNPKYSNLSLHHNEIHILFNNILGKELYYDRDFELGEYLSNICIKDYCKDLRIQLYREIIKYNKVLELAHIERINIDMFHNEISIIVNKIIDYYIENNLFLTSAKDFINNENIIEEIMYSENYNDIIDGVEYIQNVFSSYDNIYDDKDYIYEHLSGYINRAIHINYLEAFLLIVKKHKLSIYFG